MTMLDRVQVVVRLNNCSYGSKTTHFIKYYSVLEEYRSWLSVVFVLEVLASRCVPFILSLNMRVLVNGFVRKTLQI